MKINFRIILIAAIFCAGIQLHAQKLADLSTRFKAHIEYLASDSLEGRETGSKGEQLAFEYLQGQFRLAGASPGAGSKAGDWLQSFDFLAEKNPGENDFLKIGKETLKPGDGYSPLLYSSAGMIKKSKIVDVGYGISAPALGHDDYKQMTSFAGKVFVMELSSPDGVHPHSKFKDHTDIRKKIETARANGAAAVIFVNNDPNLENPSLDFSRKITQDSIPVIFIPGKKATDLAGQKVKMQVSWKEKWLTGHNVVASVDNGAPVTILFGAHYDHLGYGHEGSLHRGEKAIHNGADDNASGTAMLIELARALKLKGSKKFNYVFVAFSGEEKGLLGSHWFVNNSPIDLKQVNCMINFDMVGRMDPQNYTLGINGAGTSPAWETMLASIKVDTMHIKTSESGIGPSDHTSFYLKDIPVLHFFSGTHADYHKPSDDEPLINYKGLVDIHSFVLALVDSLSRRNKLEFRKTKDADQSKAPKFSVTLGVVPDYLFNGEGVKIDGVTEGKPAAAAGMKAGDIVLQLGDYPVKDMQGYMSALGKFKKGDATKAKIKRENEVIELPVQF